MRLASLPQKRYRTFYAIVVMGKDAVNLAGNGDGELTWSMPLQCYVIV